MKAKPFNFSYLKNTLKTCLKDLRKSHKIRNYEPQLSEINLWINLLKLLRFQGVNFFNPTSETLLRNLIFSEFPHFPVPAIQKCSLFVQTCWTVLLNIFANRSTRKRRTIYVVTEDFDKIEELLFSMNSRFEELLLLRRNREFRVNRSKAPFSIHKLELVLTMTCWWTPYMFDDHLSKVSYFCHSSELSCN